MQQPNRQALHRTGRAMACQRCLAITKQKQKKEALRFNTSQGSGAK